MINSTLNKALSTAEWMHISTVWTRISMYSVGWVVYQFTQNTGVFTIHILLFVLVTSTIMTTTCFFFLSFVIMKFSYSPTCLRVTEIVDAQQLVIATSQKTVAVLRRHNKPLGSENVSTGFNPRK